MRMSHPSRPSQPGSLSQATWRWFVDSPATDMLNMHILYHIHISIQTMCIKFLFTYTYIRVYIYIHFCFIYSYLYCILLGLLALDAFWTEQHFQVPKAVAKLPTTPLGGLDLIRNLHMFFRSRFFSFDSANHSDRAYLNRSIGLDQFQYHQDK